MTRRCAGLYGCLNVCDANIAQADEITEVNEMHGYLYRVARATSMAAAFAATITFASSALASGPMVGPFTQQFMAGGANPRGPIVTQRAITAAPVGASAAIANQPANAAAQSSQQQGGRRGGGRVL
ncbi:conserved exported hypothetical protein [Paraburkholderia piptadeniae]|uniref:Uncharacterized protein n=1 Tax=Paraburkholderia piptadeniae TaxID=1701573 RepID=A0A1N7SSY3_9BURK|nr:conserved exported hypothetical protein [Paraburkholderia piptadeniae]